MTREWIPSILSLLLKSDCRDFLTILERDFVFYTVRPPKVEKTESKNKRAQIVDNQISQLF